MKLCHSKSFIGNTLNDFLLSLQWQLNVQDKRAHSVGFCCCLEERAEITFCWRLSSHTGYAPKSGLEGQPVNLWATRICALVL